MIIVGAVASLYFVVGLYVVYAFCLAATSRAAGGASLHSEDIAHIQFAVRNGV